MSTYNPFAAIVPNELTVFHEVAPDSEPLEIGKADAIRFTAMDGSRMRWSPTNVHNQKLVLEGWKTPVPNQPLTSVLPNTPYEELYRFIGVLVHQMGGSVTVEPHEMMDDRNLTIYQLADPFYWVLKIKDD